MQFDRLKSELEQWHANGLELPVWWRDDDAVAHSPELEQLTQMSTELCIPVHLAVIPDRLEPSLSKFVDLHENLHMLVHGWRHENHEVTGKKSEFGAGRSFEARLQEAREGLEKLTIAFGARALPVFVPPWNRIGEDLIPHLPDAGYRALSTYQPRAAAEAAEGLLCVNTHLDVIDWRGTRSAVCANDFENRAIELLQARRTGRADNQEPFGILTHHLVHDAAIWQLTRNFLQALKTGPIVASFPLQASKHLERPAS